MDRAQREPEPEEQDEGRRQTAGVGEKTRKTRERGKKERNERLGAVMIFYQGESVLKGAWLCFFRFNFFTARSRNGILALL